MLLLNGSPSRKGVDIVVVGDGNTGKTSLITTLVSSIFPESVPKVLQQVRVPPEETMDNIALSITDTSSMLEDRAHTLKLVGAADAVVLVYAVDDMDTFQRLRTYWLPEITKVFKGPIIIVGNKSDVLNMNASSRDEDVMSLLEEFPNGQIDGFWKKCSARLNINVADVFNMAQRAVVYPIAPLFDTRTRELREEFKTALKRVFRIFDQDRDGVLSDSELNNFQETCFGARLQPSDIEELRTMLQNEGPGRVTAAGITFEGYLSIHRKFLQRNRAETSWLVLRQFGYDDNLRLQVPKRLLTDWDKTVALYERSMELTKFGLSFFADLFNQFDKDKDQALSPKELSELFSICPNGVAPWSITKTAGGHSDASGTGGNMDDLMPSSSTTVAGGGGMSAPSATSLMDKNNSKSEFWLAEYAVSKAVAFQKQSVLTDINDFPRGVKTDIHGNVTLAGWLAQWNMITLLQPKLTILYFYFLGFDNSKEKGISLTRPRSLEDQDNNLQRQVVRAFVFGAHNVGKATLLDTLNMKQHIQPQQQSNEKPATSKKVDSDFSFTTNAGYDLEQKSRNVLVRNSAARIKLVDPTNLNESATAPALSSRLPHYFVLTKIGAEHDILEESLSHGMVDCDLAIMVFDSTNPSSVDWLAGLQKRIPETVPCVYLATKTDCTSTGMTSEAIEEATMLCTSNSLPTPELISLVPSSPMYRQKTTRLFQLLLHAALKPDAARPISEERRVMQRRNRMLRASLRIGLVATMALSTGYFLYSLFSSTSKTSKTNNSDNKKPPIQSFRTEGHYREFQ